MADKVYKDINQFNPTTLGKSFRYDADAVYQAVVNILHTRKGERVFNPEFGLDLEDYLFELSDEGTEASVLSEINTQLKIYEPRVTVDFERSTVSVSDRNKLNVDLIFTINGVDGELFQIETTLVR